MTGGPRVTAGHPVLVADGFRLPESLRWHAGKLWMSDMDGGVVFVVGAAGAEPVLELPAQPSGLGWEPDGTLLVVSQLDARLLRVDGGDMAVVADLAPVMGAHGGDVRPNDMWVAPDGTAYIGSASFQVVGDRLIADDRVPTPLVAVSPAGEVELLSAALACPNGIAPGPGGTIVIAETRSSRLVELRAGRPGVTEYARCSAGPDGIVADPRGGFWAAFPFAGVVQRVDRGGAVLDEIDLRPRVPLDCTLGGPTGTTLFVASVAEIDHLGSSRTGRVEAFTLSHRPTEEPS